MTTAGKVPREAGRYDFLDAIRGVACVAVVLEHACEMCLPETATSVQRHFHLGPFLLPLFMMVSGFIIPASLVRCGSSPRFWVARFFRLYPLYWFSLALLATVYLVAKPVTAFNPNSAWQWVANLTMFQELLRVPHANPVFWTLTVEMFFYIAASALFSLGLIRRTTAIAWLGVAAFAVLGVGVPVLLNRRFPAGYAFLMLSAFYGMVFYRLRAGEVHGRVVVALVAALVVVGGVVAYVNFEMYSRNDNRFTFANVFPAWVASLAVFLVMLQRRGSIPRMCVGLGTISYSVYLLHPLVLFLLPLNVPPLAYMTLTVGISVGVGTLTYMFVERPAMRLGQRLLKKRPVPAPVAEPAMRRAA